MAMASSEVGINSCQSFNSVLNPHERRIPGENKNKNTNKNNNNNNGRNVSEKNLKVFVRDPLNNDNHGKDVLESSVSDDWLPEQPSSSNPNQKQISNLSQQENQSRKEKKAASSLVQIWEARTQHPSSNQSQIDSRTSSGSNPNENSEPLTEQSIKESELIQSIKEEDEEQEEEVEFTTIPSNSAEKERLRVMDIIRKLSSDPEMINENVTTNHNNENSKEVNSTELRCFPQIACSPRIRGRQAIADLLVLMLREREKELVWLGGRHCVSKFTYRGRIQSVLRIRCYERCVAVQDKHRGRSSLGSDLNRSPGGSGVKHLLREKYKSVEKKVLQEAMEKIEKESQDKIPAGEIVKKDVLIEIADNKNGLRKSAGDNNQKETVENKNELKKCVGENVLKETANNKSDLRKSAAETAENKNGSMKSGGEIAENKNGLRKSAVEISENKNGLRKPEGETIDHKTGLSKSAENKNGSMKSSGEIAENKSGLGKSSGEIAGLRKPVGETVENKNISMKASGEIAENKNGLWKSTGETVDHKNGLTKYAENKNGSMKSADQKNDLQKFVGEIAENKNGSMKSAGEASDHKNGSKKSVGETSENKNGFKKSIGETIVKETADQKSGLKKSAGDITQKETTDIKNVSMKCVVVTTQKEGKGEKQEAKEKEITKERVEEKSLTGIAEKVNLWNSGEKLNKRTDMEKGKARTEKNDVIEEATKRIINVETAERSISTKEIEKGRNKKEEACNIKPQQVTTQEDKNGLKNEIAEAKRETEESEEGKAVMGIAEKVNLWNSKEKKNKKRSFKKNQRRLIIDVETAERSINSKDMIESSSRGALQCLKKDEVFESAILKFKEGIGNKNNLTQAQESASDGSKEKTKEKNCTQKNNEMSIIRNQEAKNGIRNKPQGDIPAEESASNGSKEKTKEKDSLQFNKEMSNLRNPDSENGVQESRNEKTEKANLEEEEEEEEYVNGWDEDEEEEEEEYEYDQYNEENMYDWFDEISRPQSYWEDLRKQRYLEVLNASDSDKKGIKKLIESRTVSNFLSSELREKIDRLMISRVQSKLRIRNNTEEESEVECSARNEDNKTEQEEEEAVSDNCSQSSNESTMMSWSFRDQENQTSSSCLPESSSLVPTDHEASSSSEMQMICDLKEQMEQLQREMIELRSSMKSCIDMQVHFQKSMIEDRCSSGSSTEQRGLDVKKDPLKRKCCVCSEMPVDSLLYRCGHMCTCLKCAHELQWSSKKCPVCMAPIVDVVRAFIDS